MIAFQLLLQSLSYSYILIIASQTGSVDIWTRHLEFWETWGVVFFNNASNATTVNIKLKDIGFTYILGYDCRDDKEFGHIEIEESHDWHVPSGPGGVLMLNCYDSK